MNGRLSPVGVVAKEFLMRLVRRPAPRAERVVTAHCVRPLPRDMEIPVAFRAADCRYVEPREKLLFD
jgi:hypothetical protein